MRARAVRSEPGAAVAEASLEAVAAVHAARPNELALGKFALLGAARPIMPLGREVIRTRQRGLERAAPRRATRRGASARSLPSKELLPGAWLTLAEIQTLRLSELVTRAECGVRVGGPPSSQTASAQSEGYAP